MPGELPTSSTVRNAFVGILDPSAYDDEIAIPLRTVYARKLIEPDPHLGSQIFSFNLDNLQVGDIEDEHMPRLITQLGILGANLISEIDKRSLTEDLHRDRSRTAFSLFSVLSALEVARTWQKAAIDPVAVYMATDEVFTDAFGGIFKDLPIEEKVGIFNDAINHSIQLINQPGFTVIGT